MNHLILHVRRKLNLWESWCCDLAIWSCPERSNQSASPESLLAAERKHTVHLYYCIYVCGAFRSNKPVSHRAAFCCVSMNMSSVSRKQSEQLTSANQRWWLTFVPVVVYHGHCRRSLADLVALSRQQGFEPLCGFAGTYLVNMYSWDLVAWVVETAGERNLSQQV